MKLIYSPQPAFVSTCATESPRKVTVKNNCLESETEKLKFSAEPIASHCKYIIGIKRGDQVHYTEAKPMFMTSVVKSIDAHQQSVVEKSSVARNALGMEFGTRKRKKEIHAIEQNQIQKKIAQGEVKLIAEQKVQSMDVKESIPPVHLEAVDPANVYLLDELITPGELKTISHDLLASLELNSFTKPFAEALHDKTHVNAKIIIYFNWLFTLYSLKSKDLSPSLLAVKLAGASPIVIERLISLFTEYTTLKSGVVKYRIDAKNKDKILAWMGALALHLCSFSVEIASFAKELMIPTQRVLAIFKELGCRVNVKNKAKVATLSLPLVFPAPKVGRKS